MINPDTRALFQYWLGLRQKRKAPARGDIEPRQVKGLLPNLFILERIDDHHFVFRLAGTALCERFGREFRAHNFLSLWVGDERIQMRRFLSALLNEATPGLVTCRAETIDLMSMDLEILTLPITDQKGALNRFLGCIHLITDDSQIMYRRFVKQRVLDMQPINTEGVTMVVGNNGAPRPMRVERPELRLITNYNL